MDWVDRTAPFACIRRFFTAAACFAGGSCALACAAAEPASVGGPGRGAPPPAAIYFPTVPSDEGLPLFDPRSMPAPPRPMPGPPRGMPSSIMPVGYNQEPASGSADFGGAADAPDTFRASVLAAPQSPAYFPTMPANFGERAPPYTGPMTGMPGSLASYQPPLTSSIPEPPSPYGAPAPSSYGPAGPSLRGRLRPGPAGWAVSLEFLMLTDAHSPYGPVLVRDVNTQQSIVSSGDLKGTYGLGQRTTLTRVRSDITEFEVSYFGVYDWKRDGWAFGDNNLELAGAVALASFDFFDADRMTVDYRTSLHNLEFNWLQMLVCDTRKWVFGARYINWSDSLGIQSLDLDSGTSDMRVDASNNLLGIHGGVNQSVDWALGETIFKLRGGFFNNLASQDTLINDLDNTFALRDIGASDSNVASLGELGISHCFNPTTNTEVRFGYNLLWIQGLARAPGQVDLTDDAFSSTQIFIDGSALLHGASARVRDALVGARKPQRLGRLARSRVPVERAEAQPGAAPSAATQPAVHRPDCRPRFTAAFVRP